MIRTIQLSSCISVQGRIVEVDVSGEVVIRSGDQLYRGRPVSDGRLVRSAADNTPDPVSPRP